MIVIKEALTEMVELMEYLSGYEHIPIGFINNNNITREQVFMIWHDLETGITASVSCRGSGWWYYSYRDAPKADFRSGRAKVGTRLPGWLLKALQDIEIKGGHTWV